VTYARARFNSVLVVCATGAVTLVGAFTFPPRADRWLAFGMGCCVLLAVLAGFLVRGRGVAQRALDLPLALIGAWSIVCSRVIEHAGAGSSASAIKWLTFGSGAAICALGTIGLLIHEWSLERDLRIAAERIAAAEAIASERIWGLGAPNEPDGDQEHGSQLLSASERYADAVARASR